VTHNIRSSDWLPKSA